MQHDRTKYVEVDRHFIIEKINNRLICTPFMLTGKQLANVLPKGLLKPQFQGILGNLGMINVYKPT